MANSDAEGVATDESGGKTGILERAPCRQHRFSDAARMLRVLSQRGEAVAARCIDGAVGSGTEVGLSQTANRPR